MAPLNTRDLYAAISSDNVAAVASLLQKSGTPVNASLFFWRYVPHPDRGLPPCMCIHVAAAVGATHVLQWLVEQGADVRAEDGVGRKPLDVAAEDVKLWLVRVDFATKGGNDALNHEAGDGSRDGDADGEHLNEAHVAHLDRAGGRMEWSGYRSSDSDGSRDPAATTGAEVSGRDATHERHGWTPGRSQANSSSFGSTAQGKPVLPPSRSSCCHAAATPWDTAVPAAGADRTKAEDDEAAAALRAATQATMDGYRAQVKVMQARMMDLAAERDRLRAACEAEKACARLQLETARKSIQNVNRRQLQEILSLRDPPLVVKLTLEAVRSLLLLAPSTSGGQDSRTVKPRFRGGQSSDNSEWAVFRASANPADVIQRLGSYDATWLAASPATIADLTKYTQQVTVEAVTYSSRTCVPLCEMVKCHLRLATLYSGICSDSESVRALQAIDDAMRSTAATIEELQHATRRAAMPTQQRQQQQQQQQQQQHLQHHQAQTDAGSADCSCTSSSSSGSSSTARASRPGAQYSLNQSKCRPKLVAEPVVTPLCAKTIDPQVAVSMRIGRQNFDDDEDEDDA